MQQFKLEVVYADGHKASVVASPVAQVAYERQAKAALVPSDGNILMTTLYWLAWFEEKRAGETTAKFDDWLATVAGVEPADDEDEEASGPLGPTA